MIKFGNFVCKNQFSSLGQTLVLLNCYSIVDRTSLIPGMRHSCSKHCAVNNSYVPTYEEWKIIRAENLIKDCKTKVTNKARCDFAVSTSFNLTGSYWSSGGIKLENITWKSDEYPRLNDILTICGFGAFTSGNFQSRRSTFRNLDKVDFCVKNEIS